MKWTDKGFAAADGGVQVGSKSFDTNATFDLYEEVATLDTVRKGKAGGFFDVRGGYKVWRNLAVGAGFSWYGNKSDVSINASVPDPIRHDQPRAVSLSAAGAKRSEAALHLTGTWMVPVTDKIDVGIGAGPSIFFVKNDTVTALNVTDPGPVTSAHIEKISKTAGGFHLGVDVRYMLTSRYGVGGLLRYTWAKANLPGGKLTAGGVQLGGGVRVRF
jgi:hypothetical protein